MGNRVHKVGRFTQSCRLCFTDVYPICKVAWLLRLDVFLMCYWDECLFWWLFFEDKTAGCSKIPTSCVPIVGLFLSKGHFSFIGVYPLWEMWKKSVPLSLHTYTRGNILPQLIWGRSKRMGKTIIFQPHQPYRVLGKNSNEFFRGYQLHTLRCNVYDHANGKD